MALSVALMTVFSIESKILRVSFIEYILFIRVGKTIDSTVGNIDGFTIWKISMV